MRYFASVTVFLCLCACTGTAQQGQNFDASGTERIRAGVTDKQTVQSLLGLPLTSSVRGVDETWTYSFITGTNYGTTAMIPVVGGLVAMNTQNTTNQKQVVVIFHNNVVQTCTVTLHTQTGTIMSMNQESSTREIPCGQSVN
jgi:outer membrane protein assembly factor BamE (lipoprotein component of BamABCDE complex)